MTRLHATACAIGIVFCGLLTSRFDTDAGLYPSAAAQEAEAIADMTARAAEHACGGDAIKTSRGLRCARDINPALVADAGAVR